MPIPSVPEQAELFGAARRTLKLLLEEVVRADSFEEDALTARASSAIDLYANELLSQLMAAVRPANPDELAWLKREYLALIVEFATEIRDSIPESNKRHAVVQGLQCKILEQERQLRLMPPTSDHFEN